MNHYDIDPGFERHLEERLRAYAQTGVEPFDAVEIAHNAARRRKSGPSSAPAAGLPRPLRWVVLSAAAFAMFVVSAFALNILLPEREAGPSPTAAGVLSTPASPVGSLPPVVDPNLTPDPNATPGVNLSPAASASPVGATATPAQTGQAAGPGDSPEPDETASPPTSPEPTTSEEPSPPSPPAAAVGSVAAGDLHYCAVLTDGRIACWGENSEGELGDGTTINRWTASLAVQGIDDARLAAAGTRFSCAVSSDRSVWCWGGGIQGGSGSTTPERVGAIDDARAVTAGAAHACALRSNGRVTCWGLGQLGQLGNGTIVHNTGNPPVAVSDLDDVQQISAGWNHTCALRGDGSVWCWGGNGDGATGYGQIGDGTVDNAPSPVQVQGLPGPARSVSAGGWTTCAALSTGDVWCWGYGERGGLGDGAGESSSVPVQVSGLSDARQVDVGGWHACALRANGRVACWGANDGQLGDGSRTDRFTPVAVEGLRNVTVLSAGWIDTCAVSRDGSLWCWGSNHGPTPARQEVRLP